MSLATRCPECKTLFKVTSAQLQAQQGKVKCGYCGTVFSGIDHLTPADADTWQNPSAPTRVEAGLDIQLALNTANSNANSGLNVNSENQYATLSTTVLMLPKSASISSHLFKAIAPYFQHFRTEAPWPILAKATLITLLVILSWQIIWWQRAGVAWALPVLDAPLQGIASALGTSTAQPASKSIVIVGSNLSNPTEKTLRADLRIAHRGKSPSYWPVFQLQLLNSQQAVIATKVITPADYSIKTTLAAEDLNPRILPGEEIDVVILLNISKLLSANTDSPPTGFRVTLYDQRL
jgi:predicted Zn finger-like uncharacterized protein